MLPSSLIFHDLSKKGASDPGVKNYIRFIQPHLLSRTALIASQSSPSLAMGSAGYARRAAEREAPVAPGATLGQHCMGKGGHRRTPGRAKAYSLGENLP